MPVAPSTTTASDTVADPRARAVTLLAAALLLLPLLAMPQPAEASSRWLDAEQRFVNLVNHERAERGLGTLTVSLQMVRVARDWSGQMDARGQLGHRPDLGSSASGPWERLGENVGRTGHREGESIAAAVDRLHAAFMASPGHRENVLGPYNQVGVGVVVSTSGTLWVTLNFLQGPVGAFPLFEDVGGNTHERAIERVWIGDLASGCTFRRYCPGQEVTRAQMATFIARALGLRPAVTNRFDDVDPDSPHAGYIDALVQAGIVTGCDEDRFCPADPVSRAQTATFLARALGLAPQTMPEFVDVLPSSPHFGNVNAVAERAITAGCDTTGQRYCPDQPVRRDQMASYLSRAFDRASSFWAPPTSGDGTGSSDGGSSAASGDGSAEIGEARRYERDPDDGDDV